VAIMSGKGIEEIEVDSSCIECGSEHVDSQVVECVEVDEEENIAKWIECIRCLKCNNLVSDLIITPINVIINTKNNEVEKLNES